MKYLLALFTTISLAASGQNLYDVSASIRFAEHLYLVGRYKDAAAEYERVLFLEPGADTLLARMMRSYRKAGSPKIGLEAAKKYYGRHAPNAETEKEYIALLIEDGQTDQARQVLRASNVLDEVKKSDLLVLTYTLQGRWDEADSAGQITNPSAPVRQLLTAYRERPKKSKMLAVVLSAIPGLGKVYVGEPLDGMGNLATTAGLGYLGYRALVLGEASTTLGVGLAVVAGTFYISNFYGSYKAAERFNERYQRQFVVQARALTHSYFP